MTDIAYNSGRRAFINGWTVCIFKLPELIAAWYAGWQDEHDDFIVWNRSVGQ